MPAAEPRESAARPNDDEVVTMIDALDRQREYVLRSGSTTAGVVLEAVSLDLASGGVLSGVLPARVRFGDFPGLRLMSVVHLLALERRAPRIALRLPTLGGIAPRNEGERSALRADVVELLATHPEEVATGMARTPQTNEPGRAALLRCALSRLNPRLPVRLRELGASAGLNLRADRLPGLPGLEAGPLPRITDRVGCDRQPVDPATTTGRNLLTSFVWVDDVDRFERLRAALKVVDEVPATVVPQDALEFCESIALADGSTTVIWHSAMWVYLDAATRSGILDAIARLGRAATTTTPLAHVSWEWPSVERDPGSPFELVMRRWCGADDDGAPRLLATGTSHGTFAQLVPASESWIPEERLST